MLHEVIDIASGTNQPATVDEAWYNLATAETPEGGETKSSPTWTGL
jgi:hypothetical protein